MFVKRLCLEEIKNAESLGSYIASRVVPLNKRPGLRPIGVVEVLRRISGKAVMILLKKYVIEAVGLLQLCGRQDLKPSMMSSIMIRSKVFYKQMQRTYLIKSIERLCFAT